MSPPRLRMAIFGVAGAVLISKLLGFFREIVVADKFGTSADYDLYLLGVMLPALFYGILNYAGFYLLVPFFTKKIQLQNQQLGAEGLRSIWPVINFSVVISILLAIAAMLIAPLAMKIWAGDYSQQSYATIVLFSRLMAAMIVLGTVEAVLRAYLNVKKIYTYPAASYIVFNIVSIGCIFLFAERFSSGAIVIGVLSGLVAQNLYLLARWFQLVPLKSFTGKFYNSEIRTLMSTASFLVLIETINRSWFLIDRYVAVDFGEGIISALNYARVLIQLPEAIIGFAIGSVLYPLFSETALETDGQRMLTLFKKGTIASLLLAVPLTAIFLAGATDIIYLVFHRGEFDVASVSTTAAILKPYAPAIIALFIISISIRASYSMGQVGRVLIFAAVALAVKLVGTFLLSHYYGYAGISAATSAGHLLFALLLCTSVVRHTGTADRAAFVYRLLKIVMAGFLAYVGASYVLIWLDIPASGPGHAEAVLRLVVQSVTIAVIFLTAVWMLGLKEQLGWLLPFRKETIGDN